MGDEEHSDLAFERVDGGGKTLRGLLVQVGHGLEGNQKVSRLNIATFHLFPQTINQLFQRAVGLHPGGESPAFL